MCGIFGLINGCVDNEYFLEVADLNTPRGNNGIGIAFIYDGFTKVIRQSGHFDKSLVFDRLQGVESTFGKPSAILGHTVAPTGKAKLVHPIEHSDYILAHNGILLNFKDYLEYALNVDLDSSYLLGAIIKETTEQNPASIASAIKVFDGQQSCWLVTPKRNVYIWRVMSTLFTKHDDNDFMFSSVQLDGMTALQQGKLLQVYPNVQEITQFKYYSPYSA